EHHEADVLGAASLERDERVGERADGADVGVEIEAEAHPQQDVARVLEPRDARVPQGPDEHRRALSPDPLQQGRRQRGAVPEVAIGAEIERPELEGKPRRVAVPLEQPGGLARHLRSDAVARNDRNLCHQRPAAASRAARMRAATCTGSASSRSPNTSAASISGIAETELCSRSTREPGASSWTATKLPGSVRPQVGLKASIDGSPTTSSSMPSEIRSVPSGWGTGAAGGDPEGAIQSAMRPSECITVFKR